MYYEYDYNLLLKIFSVVVVVVVVDGKTWP